MAVQVSAQTKKTMNNAVKAGGGAPTNYNATPKVKPVVGNANNPNVAAPRVAKPAPVNKPAPMAKPIMNKPAPLKAGPAQPFKTNKGY